MDNQNSGDGKQPWFGSKRYGIGSRPASWQGRLVVAPLILLEIVVVSIAPGRYPSWFKPKTIGSGFVPATWQGWLVVVGPVVIVMATVQTVSHIQRQRQ